MPSKRDNDEERIHRIERMILDGRPRRPAKASLDAGRRSVDPDRKTTPRKKR